MYRGCVVKIAFKQKLLNLRQFPSEFLRNRTTQKSVLEKNDKLKHTLKVQFHPFFSFLFCLRNAANYDDYKQ